MPIYWLEECVMVITDYRVQSVLRTYTRELQRSNLSAKANSDTVSAGFQRGEGDNFQGEGKCGS